MSTAVSTPSLRLREPAHAQPAQPEDAASNNPNLSIKFRHPRYADDFDQNILLDLHPFDDARGGLQYGVAFLACAIVAGNSWKTGYFTETRNGSRLEYDWDQLLMGKEYYYWIPPGLRDPSASVAAYKYPVYPSFNHWRFPHRDLPAEWPNPPSSSGNSSGLDRVPTSASGVTNYVTNRDEHCIISQGKDSMERAHLCPRKEIDWFQKNAMKQYNRIKQFTGDSAIDDPSNAIALRSDLHSTFDNRSFVITLKQSKWTVHFLEETSTLGSLYHNTSIQLNSNISPTFLFVRFAWAIFPGVKQFLEQQSPRDVLVSVVTKDGTEEDIKTLSDAKLDEVANPSKSRTSSPTKKSKREAPTDASPEDDDENGGRKRHRTSVKTKMRDAVEGSPSTTTSLSEQSQIECDEGLNYLEKLQREWIRAQRPKDPRLICCDYDSAERAERLGLPGKKENGGAHLCLRCLGVEYQDALP